MSSALRNLVEAVFFWCVLERADASENISADLSYVSNYCCWKEAKLHDCMGRLRWHEVSDAQPADAHPDREG